MIKSQTADRHLIVVAVLALTLIPAGCREMSTNLIRSQVAANKTSRMLAFSPMDVAVSASNQRYVAEKHTFAIVSSESNLQKSWESAVAFCGTIQCEVVSSSITARTAEIFPSGTISMRVAPEDLNRLLAYIEKLGKVAEHTTNREDKTTSVVDTEARIKNLTSLRDSLRAMLAKPSATVKDLVEIQQQLADTQSQLDSETAQRKILANETEKIAVEVSFNLESSAGHAGGFAEILRALRESGDMLADSTASLITTIVAILPWLILIVPVVWLLVKAWKAFRRRRARTVPLPPGTH